MLGKEAVRSSDLPFEEDPGCEEEEEDPGCLIDLYLDLCLKLTEFN